MKTLLLLLAMFFCGCATVPRVGDMLDSTVQVHVDIQGSLLSADGKTVEQPMETGWTGTGVVYAKTDGLRAPVESRFLTANHVLETPPVGALIPSPFGVVRVDAVLVTITTRGGKTCEVKALVLGTNDVQDVAVGLAYCDAGRVATIATSAPEAGVKVFTVGHPQGVRTAVVTEGWVSGYLDGYLLTSAGAYGGNSGGGLWYNGEVVGLLVRASGSYPLITLATPLQAVLDRIAAAEAL